MQIERNSRQIPSDKIYTANKKYSDILYGYLQTISLLDKETGIRYIPKKEISYVKIADILGMHRHTVSDKIKNLMQQDLLYYNQLKKRYELMVLKSELATLLPNDTVRILSNTLQERCLSILTYLLKTYIQHKQESCQINLDIIKEQVGLCSKNKGYNNQIILDCFIILEQLGLITYSKIKVKDSETGGYRDIYILEKVNNKIIYFK